MARRETISGLRDELAKFAVCPEWLDETMKMIERALAAERAATLGDCLEAVCDSQRAGSRDTADSAIRKLPYDRSALHDALVQARREQRREDAAWLEHCANKYYTDECHVRARIALRTAAENLKAQKD